jgi:hypothetical protein
MLAAIEESEADPESEPPAAAASGPAAARQPRRCDTSELFLAERDADKQIMRAGVRVFVRTTASDGDTVGALFHELRKRRIGPDVPIAIIGEEDTEYARQLRAEIALAHRRDAPLSPAARGVAGVATLQTVHSFGYLRGIDGKAGDAEKAGEAKSAGDKTREQAEVERPEGDSQVDYLRRLAELMRQRERSLDRHAQEGGKSWINGRMHFGAIAIVGNDYYDKLLVLQALRPMFPEALFFTTDLYAAMLHPADNRVTRNLVVGSGFGLTVHPALQGDTPPFRDSYQTATFMAVKVSLAMNGRDGESLPGELAARWLRGVFAARWQRPTVSEVGRTRFYNLTAEGGKCHSDPLYCAQTADFSRRLADLRPLEIGFIVAASLALLVGLSGTVGGFLWYWLLPRWNSPYKGWHHARWIAAAIFILALAIAWFVHRLLADANKLGGEPFAWFEGVSVWPSSLVRLAALLFAAGGLVYALRRTHTRLAKTEDSFFREDLAFEERAGFVDPKACWGHYRKCMRWWRIGWAGLVKFAVVSAFLFSLVPLSTQLAVPARSEWAFGVNNVLLGLAGISAMLLLVCVATAIRHTRNLARGLCGKVWWPDKLRREHGLPTGSPVQFDEWLSLQVIARQSEAVNNLIYFPFLALLLLAIARNRMFDNWSMPPAVFLVLGFCFAYLIVSAVSLRLSAERARKRALATLRGTLIRLQGVAQDDAPPVKHLVDQCKTLIEQTEKLDRGAFSPFTRQPLVRGILALAGGISGAALFEYASAANF